MRLTEKIKSFVPRSKKIIVIIGLLLIIVLVFFISLFSLKAGGSRTNSVKTNTASAKSPAVNNGPAHDSSDLPDLAEAIARFSEISDANGDMSHPLNVNDPDREAFVEDFWRWIFGEAGIPASLARKVAASALDSPSFIMELLIILQNDPYTIFLVDKTHPLPDNYEPEDLVPLSAGVYRLSRDGLALRKSAADALREMAAAAASEGITLTIGSAYRSQAYQAQVYEREVQAYGKETADRESAQPGKSQHQLGLVVDFYPIDDDFAESTASRWLIDNAGRFGWSLSYPDGYEDVTGYCWESWHYRYVGKDLAVFIGNYFDGIQQYALQFIHAWQEQAAE